MLSQFAIFDVGTPELLVILALALLLFGGKKLPELSRSIGESIAEIKKGASSAADFRQEVNSQVAEAQDKITRPS